MSIALVTGIFPVYVLILDTWFPDAFFESVQEDSYLEWATFWAFAIAAGYFVKGAVNQAREIDWRTWFPVAAAIFCAIFALEEIAWGQRLFAYQPPEYFLISNFELEFSFYNNLGSVSRWVLLSVAIAVPFVVAPLLSATRWFGTLFAATGIRSPSKSFILSGLLTFIIHATHPFLFASEVVELMLGALFLIYALGLVRASVDNGGRAPVVEVPELNTIVLATAGFAVIGVLQSALMGTGIYADRDRAEAASLESMALAQDLRDWLYESGTFQTGTVCGDDQRMTAYVDQFRKSQRMHGRFAAAVKPYPERINYFLDPWNLPYWLRHSCSEKTGKEIVVVYSFGPNRRRDSGEKDIRGDDVSAIVFEKAYAPR